MDEIATNFDILESGYNLADETINFGTRNLADGDTLYQTGTLAILKCHESKKGVLSPHINTLCKNGDIYFSVNNTMKIFKSRELNDIAFNVNFDAYVDVFSVGDDFFIICFRNGTIHLLDCKNNFEVTDSLSILEHCEGMDVSQIFFVASFIQDDCSVLILTRNGQLIRIVCESLSMKMEIIYEFGFIPKVASFLYPFLLVNGEQLAIFHVRNNILISDSDFGWKFKTVHPLDHMFLALDFEGNLFRICAITMVVFPVKNTILYKNFLLISDSKSDKHILTVTKNEQSCLQLLSYPDFSISYSLQVTGHVHIIAPESLNDELLYIAKTLTEDNLVSEIRFHIVYETEPEQRLERLLRKHKYKEAEKFAALFRLNVSQINKAKAREIIDKTVCDSKDVDNLINLLNLIEDDDEFKLQACLNMEASCSHLKGVRRILKYGCDLSIKEQNKAAEELQKCLINLKFKFETYTMVYKYDQMLSWLEFAECNLIDELKSFLGNRKIAEAKIIYNRLDELTVNKITVDQISDILNILNTIPMSMYQPFLPTFIPITISILPSTLPLFVKWTYRKVFYLEKHQKTDFPNNAIKFLENIIDLMEGNDSSDISFQRECTLAGFSKLSLLLSVLKNIKILKNEHGVIVPVDKYLSGPENVVRILLNVHVDDFDRLLKTFLYKFMLESNLDPNEIFRSEIIDLMKYEQQYWVNVVVSILNCITSISIKLECVINILDSASVPWCETVRNIAQDSLKYSHPLILRVKELIENEPMQIVLRKPKYQIQEKRITNIDILRYVVNRIIYCNEETMIDDVYKLCKTREERKIASVLLITRLIDRKCLEKAVELLNNMPPGEQFDVVNQLKFDVYDVVNGKCRMSDDERRNYHSIAGSVIKRLVDGIPSQLAKVSYQDDLNLIKSVYNLREKLQIKTTIHKLKRPSMKKSIIERILEENSAFFESNRRSVEDVMSTCKKISALFSLDEELLKFCDKSGDYNFILKTAKEIYEKDFSAKILCLMAVLLLKYVGIYNAELCNNSYDSDTSIFWDGVDNEVFLDGLQMAHKLVERAVCIAPSEDLGKCLEVANWVNCSFYLLKCENKELRTELFGDLYSSEPTIPGFLTFTTIKNTFNCYCQFIKNFNNPNNDYFVYFKFDTISSEDLLNMIKTLPTIVENLCKEGQQFTSYKIVSTLRNSLIQYSNIDKTITLYLNKLLQDKCIPMLMHSVIRCNTFDTFLLYNLLLMYNRKDSIEFALNSLRLFKRHPRKFASLIQVALRFFEYHNQSDIVDIMRNNLITFKWWKRFDRRSYYDAFFKGKSNERFEMLVDANCLDSKLVEEYAKDYDLNVKTLCACFLKRLFLNWKPEYVIETDISNKRRLVMKSNEMLLKRCHEIMRVMETELVQQIINSLWGSMNKYYYEVLITMLNICSEISPEQDKSKEINMLMFLKNYQRVSSPSEREKEMWYSQFPDTHSLDPLSEFRIPFSGFLFNVDIWSIIRPEINLKTYKLWFKVIDIVSPFLNINDICSYVVRDVVASGILSENTSEEWVLYSKHTHLFAEIEECVKHISDPERTTSVLYHLLTHTPNGMDQVTAATMCYKYAVEYKNSTVNSEVENAYVKVEKKYFTCCATHILYTNQLAEKKYMDLVAQPNELILALYLDDRILKRADSVQLVCPDINKATEALASLFNIDINKIRNTLVENWLLDGLTSTFDFDSSIVYSDTTNIDNLKRAAYVCTTQLHLWQDYLIKKGLGVETSEQKDLSFRTRALKVFAMISDAESITLHTELNYDEFMNFIDKLALLSSLEYLGIKLDVEALEEYNKKELLNRLKHYPGNKLNIKTMADICMTYKIYDLKYWEIILNASIKFSMFVELKNYLAFLKDERYFNKQFYVNAWQKLIENYFVSLSSLKTDQLKLNKVLLKNFLMIQSCPVLHDLKFEKLFRKCMVVGKPEFAAVLLQYISNEQRVVFAKEIMELKTDLSACLCDLAEKGLCTTDFK